MHIILCNALALLLHQRARMERLAKELNFENEELEKLKGDVNNMEHDLMQRRLRRVSCTTSIPTVSNFSIIILIIIIHYILNS